jgi:predicted secreted protein
VVSTRPNDPPSVSSVSASPQQLTAGGTATVTVDAGDPDGDSLGYSWSASGNWSVSGSGESVTVQAPSSYGETGTVSVTVDDGFGGQATGRTTLSTVANRNPVLTALTANPRAVAPGGQTTIQATASDPNGDTINYSWTTPKGWSKSGSGDSITLTAPGSYGQRGLVEVTLTDGNGGRVRGSILVRTDRNQSPIISNLTANPVVVKPGGTSTLTATATDPNGDSLDYTWNVPQNWSQAGSGKQIDVTAPNQANASATITVTVSDGQGGSSRSAVVLQTINNRPPTIQSLSATPQNVAPKEKTTIKASVTDPESDSLTYNWILPKGWKGSSSSDTITATAPRAYGKQFRIRLEVRDGFNTVTGSILVSMVSNEDPQVNAFTVKPGSLKDGQEATARVKASDPLGDSLQYSWSLSNNNWSKSGSGASIKVTSPSNTDSRTQLTVTVEDKFGGKVSKTKTIRSRRALYSFDSHRFTNCGRGGRVGPQLSRCRQAYNTNWDNNSNYYEMDRRGIQEWTVPETATYEVRVAGAEGGPSNDRSPGRGNVVSATVDLERGQTLSILVGQRGRTGDDREGSGGGGGSFVVATDNYANAGKSDIVAIAGGGGGGGDNNSSNKHGQSGECGGDGERHPGSGACNGRGGTSEYGDVGGGGGGGFRGNGQDANGRNADGGRAFKNGGRGGNSGTNMPGGFGGGGGGSYSCGYGGGGGGYSGGGGGEWNNGCGGVGGGGGSFVTRDAKSRNTDAGSNQGHGYVVIDQK